MYLEDYQNFTKYRELALKFQHLRKMSENAATDELSWDYATQAEAARDELNQFQSTLSPEELKGVNDFNDYRKAALSYKKLEKENPDAAKVFGEANPLYMQELEMFKDLVRVGKRVDSGERVIDKAHPKSSTLGRLNVKNLGGNNALGYLKGVNPNLNVVQTRDGGFLLASPDGNIHVDDPSAFSSDLGPVERYVEVQEDLNDIFSEALQTGAEEGGATIGAGVGLSLAGTGPFGVPAAIALSAVGAGLGGAASEDVRQRVGQWVGTQKGYDTTKVLASGILGAGGTALFGPNITSKQAEKLAPKFTRDLRLYRMASPAQKAEILNKRLSVFGGVARKVLRGGGSFMSGRPAGVLENMAKHPEIVDAAKNAKFKDEFIDNMVRDFSSKVTGTTSETKHNIFQKIKDIGESEGHLIDLEDVKADAMARFAEDFDGSLTKEQIEASVAYEKTLDDFLKQFDPTTVADLPRTIQSAERIRQFGANRKTEILEDELALLEEKLERAREKLETAQEVGNAEKITKAMDAEVKAELAFRRKRMQLQMTKNRDSLGRTKFGEKEMSAGPGEAPSIVPLSQAINLRTRLSNNAIRDPDELAKLTGLDKITNDAKLNAISAINEHFNLKSPQIRNLSQAYGLADAIEENFSRKMLHSRSSAKDLERFGEMAPGDPQSLVGAKYIATSGIAEKDLSNLLLLNAVAKDPSYVGAVPFAEAAKTIATLPVQRIPYEDVERIRAVYGAYGPEARESYNKRRLSQIAKTTVGTGMLLGGGGYLTNNPVGVASILGAGALAGGAQYVLGSDFALKKGMQATSAMTPARIPTRSVLRELLEPKTQSLISDYMYNQEQNQ